MAKIRTGWFLGAVGAAVVLGLGLGCGNAGQAGLGGSTNVGYSGGKSPFARSDARDFPKHRGVGGSGIATTGTDMHSVAMPTGSGISDVSGDPRGDLIAYQMIRHDLQATGAQLNTPYPTGEKSAAASPQNQGLRPDPESQD